MLNKLKDWWNNLEKPERHCKLCDALLNDDNAILKLDTTEGEIEINICDGCADSFEKMRQKMIQKLEQ